MQQVKNILKKSVFYNIFVLVRKKLTTTLWILKGSPVSPPDPVKLGTVKEYAGKFDLKIFVETGTYLGQMVDGIKDNFDEIFSIELDNNLFEQAKKRFSEFKNITILHGDSAQQLPECIKNIHNPVLFWLDAHYSAGFTSKGNLYTPIKVELDSILRHPLNKEHVILIDDARCFNGDDDYPTIDELKQFVMEKNPDLFFSVKDDIIRIHKKFP
jgi:hypothetical protein